MVFRSVRGGQKSVYACIYFQCDGYWQDLGVRLAEFLDSCLLVNGLGANLPKDKIVCNGFGCLVAQFIAQFKTGPGHLYLFSTDCKLQMEFVYVVEYNCDAPTPLLSVKSWQGRCSTGEQEAEFLSPAGFRAFCQRSGAYEDDITMTCAPKRKKIRMAPQPRESDDDTDDEPPQSVKLDQLD